MSTSTGRISRRSALALLGALLAVDLVGCTKTVIVYPSAAAPTTPVAATTPIAATPACVDKSAADAMLKEFLADAKAWDWLQAAKDVNRLANLFADYPSISIAMRQAARDLESADSWSLENTGDLGLSMKMAVKFSKKAYIAMGEASAHFDEVSYC